MNYSKLAPALAAALEGFRRDGRAGLAGRAATLGLMPTAPVHRPARVVVFVQGDDEGGLERLRVDGLEMNPGAGTTRTAIVTLDAVDRLSEEPAVDRIVPARRLRLLMDVAPGKVGLPAFRARTDLDGRGVVVGVVDSGIQPTHPAFGRRIRRIWDQTLPGPGVAEGGYGMELKGRHQTLSRDTVGHGTMVAGIAAGADETYTGVAPHADLVVVKSDRLDAHVADGVRYVFRVAGELGRPAVVNLSLGGHWDAHDGTDPLSRILDAASGPGRIVCCAAGNDGIDDIHAQVEVEASRTRTISCALAAPAAGQPAATATFDGWYSGSDRVAVAVASPAGPQTPFQEVRVEGSPVGSYDLPGGKVEITTPGPDPSNGDHNFLVQITPSAPTPEAKPGAWRLRLRGDRVRRGRVDVWSVDSAVAQFTGRSVRDAEKVGAPATAASAVTVASYTTKVQWETVLGEPKETGLELDDISDFSSEGPLRDGHKKPDVTAPGAMIASSLSADAPVLLDFLVDDLNTISAGTSMASPFVAGLVALLLQRDPGLDPEGVKRLLRAHSRVPGRRSGAFDPKWGYGLVDATRL